METIYWKRKLVSSEFLAPNTHTNTQPSSLVTTQENESDINSPINLLEKVLNWRQAKFRNGAKKTPERPHKMYRFI